MTSNKSDPTSGNRPNLKCSICGKEFENLGDMQRHTTVEHIQKGELPSGSKDA
jgi:stress-induced morphogen